jgi:ubiquinone biosynthesis accessory factor UbiK
MLNLKAIEQLAERIGALLPADASIIQDEFKSNVKAAITSVLTRMDLVTRDEFDAQTVLLKRTREKLDQLEAEIAALQSQPKSN